MHRKLPQSSGNVLGYQISGTITEDEMKEMHRDIETALSQHGTIRLLVEIGDISAPEPKAVWEDLKLTPEYIRKVERYAIVGDQQWQKWATDVTDLLTQGEARYFDSSEVDRAWEWIKK